jgi:hypothetical protein
MAPQRARGRKSAGFGGVPLALRFSAQLALPLIVGGEYSRVANTGNAGNFEVRNEK